LLNAGRLWTLISFILSRGGDGILLFIASRPALGPTHPPNQWVQGAVYPAVKRAERRSDHSPPCSAEVENAWSSMAWHLVEFRIRLHDMMLKYRIHVHGVVLS